MKNVLMAAVIILISACSTPQKSEPRSDPEPATVEEAVPRQSTPLARSMTLTEPVVNTDGAKAPTISIPGPVKSDSSSLAKLKPMTQIWKLQKGKLNGPFVFGHPVLLAKTKNKKSNGTTTETCYRYATYAVIELKSSDEVGSAEISIRHDPTKSLNLCMPQFKGKTSDLRIIEGYFAGVAGGLLMVDGADSSEGQTEFQLFDANSGEELLKSFHHPLEELSIVKVDDAVSLDFFAKMVVKCELASEGDKCWRQVLQDNKVVGKTPMPDCAGAFSQNNTPITEQALVFTRARLSKLGGPIKFLGGKATCQPAP